jgi:hypothetical protein
MLIDRLRKHIVEPLYNNGCYTTDEYVVLNYALKESERRLIDIMSIGCDRRLHQYMDSFPWHELEELLGEHLRKAIKMTNRKSELAVARKEAYLPNIYDKYAFHHRL